jgi:hypothetical protein
MPSELPGPWTLPVAGFEILTVEFSASCMRLVAYVFGGEHCSIDLIGPFELREPDGRAHRLDPSSQAWEELVVLLSLRHDTVAAATATAESDLFVELASGRTIRIGPDDRFVSWEMSGPGTLDLVAGVGGGDPRWRLDN